MKFDTLKYLASGPVSFQMKLQKPGYRPESLDLKPGTLVTLVRLETASVNSEFTTALDIVFTLVPTVST